VTIRGDVDFFISRSLPRSGCEAWRDTRADLYTTTVREILEYTRSLRLRGTGRKQTYVDPEQLELPDVQGEPFAGMNEASCDFVLVGEVEVRVLIAPANLLKKHRARQLVVLNKLTMQNPCSTPTTTPRVGVELPVAMQVTEEVFHRS
jgi:hypothetical protein